MLFKKFDREDNSIEFQFPSDQAISSRSKRKTELLGQ